MSATWYGACGVKFCADCLPIYDASNNPIGDEPPDATTCPECRTGKHAACDGQTWDHERDEPGVCPCWVAGHEES